MFDIQTGDLVVSCSEEADDSTFLNDIVVQDDLAFITDSFSNQLWQMNITAAVAGECDITLHEMLPVESFVLEEEFMSNGKLKMLSVLCEFKFHL